MDPKFFQTSTGRRYSLEALREKIETQFEAETEGRVDILSEAGTPQARRELIEEAANYVLAVESIFLSKAQKRELIDAAYAGLFGFGPLDRYIADEQIIEITIHGHTTINARYGFGPLGRLPIRFDDDAHLRRTIDRLLMLHGAQLVEWHYFLETGIILHGRPIRLGLILPPVTPLMQVEMRLHPSEAFTLEELIAGEMLSPAAAQTITDHLQGRNGLLIVGHVNTGKSTLLGALLPTLPGSTTLIQRAAELRAPASIDSRHPTPPTEDDPGMTINELVHTILDEPPDDWLVLDEMRDDAAEAAWAALNAPARCVWVFRGGPQPKRVASALMMLLRRVPAAMSIPKEDLAHMVIERFPLVLSLDMQAGRPRVVALSRFAFDHEGDGALTLAPYAADAMDTMDTMDAVDEENHDSHKEENA